MHPFSTRENIVKPYGFLMFSGGVEKGCIGNEWVNVLSSIRAEIKGLRETHAEVATERCFMK